MQNTENTRRLMAKKKEQAYANNLVQELLDYANAGIEHINQQHHYEDRNTTTQLLRDLSNVIDRNPQHVINAIKTITRNEALKRQWCPNCLNEHLTLKSEAGDTEAIPFTGQTKVARHMYHECDTCGWRTY